MQHGRRTILRWGACLAVMSICCAASLQAQTRATPVEVQNSPTVKIDSTTNTVKAQQTGSWNVGVTGAPTFKIDSTTNTVKSQQTGTWNVGLTGTPSVNIANTPTVVTATQSSMVPLWTTDQVVAAAGESVHSDFIGASGYRDLRLFLRCSTSSSQVRVVIQHLTLSGSYVDFAQADFGSQAKVPANGGNIAALGGECWVSIPVTSNSYRIRIRNTNTSGDPITVYADDCWAYLVN